MDNVMPQRGEDILTRWHLQGRYLRSERVIAGHGLRCKQYLGGKVISVIKSAVNTGYAEPFDLAEVLTDTFILKSNGGYDEHFCIRGAWLTVGTSAFTWDAANDQWTLNSPVSADAYVYVAINRTALTATLSIAGTFPTSDPDNYEYFPLWKLPWDSTNARINKGYIQNRRGSLHVPGMG